MICMGKFYIKKCHNITRVSKFAQFLGKKEMNMTKHKRHYEPMTIEMQSLACGNSLLAASVVTGSKVDNIGQEVGMTYLFSTENGIDSNTGKTFSHEWESGTDAK